MTGAVPLRMLALALAERVPSHRTALERRRDAALRRLFADAGHRVPFVTRMLREAGVAPDEFRDVRDLSRLPITTKRDYRDAGPESVLARDVVPGTLVDRTTSGSTGERMTVKRTWAEERLLNAFRWRALRWCGHGVRDRLALLDFRLTERPGDEPALIRATRSAGFWPRRVFDGLGEEADATAVAAFRPDTVAGMTSVVARLADASAKHGLRPRLVTTGGELMTPPLRARIAAFGAPVADFYGCNELNLIAWQCPAGAGTYHVCDDAHVVEVVGRDGREVAVGERGDVVATSLFSRTMPIVRYRLDDVAVRGPERCPCGAAFSTLLDVCGRTIDAFDLGDGRDLHPWEILNVVRTRLAWARQLQLVQRSRDAIVLRIVPLHPPDAADVSAIEAAARVVLGGRARFHLETTPSIEPGPSGKARPFVPLAR